MTLLAGKIAILLPDLRGGGVERMHVNMARQWIAGGYRVEFVLLRYAGELLPLLPDKCDIRNLNVARIREAVLPLRTYLREQRPAVLLAAMWPLTVVAIATARTAGFKGRVIVSDHVALTHSPRTETWLRRAVLSISMTLFYPLAHERIAVCSGVADDLSRLSGIKRERFKVIFNPAAGGWTGEAPRPMISLPHYDVLILSVGSLKKQKDHETLIRAFALLGDQRNAHLVILGEGNERKRLESLVATLRLEGRVHMPGFAIDARPYYDAADLFVLSSRYEGFGNVIVEALERGVPVVSTRCPHGPQEILDNGTFGRLVPVGDPRALADAIDGALRADHDKSALKHRASIFDVNRIASQYLSLMFPGKDTKA